MSELAPHRAPSNGNAPDAATGFADRAARVSQNGTAANGAHGAAHELPVYRFPKNSREEVRATLGEFKGMDVVSLRVWAVGNDDERPTPKGLTVRAEQARRLLEAVQAIVDAIEAA